MYKSNEGIQSGSGKSSLLAGALLLVSLAACMSMPKEPADALMAADSAIKEAEQARGANYASNDLVAAHEKIAAARALIDKAKKDRDGKEMMQARLLADEARSDAELATARAREARAESASKDMQQNNESLQQEIQRKNGS
jgi:hypothetical protein